MSFITVAGEQLIAQRKGLGQPLVIDRFILASIPDLGAEPEDRVAAIPSAGQIVYDQPPTQRGFVNPNQVVYSLHLDTSIGDFSFNWLGIASGGVLVAAVHLPAPQDKVKTAGGVTGNNLTRNILLAFSGAQTLTGITVEASTWQIDFTARLWDMDERRRRNMQDWYGRQLFFASGWQLVRTGSTYNLQPGLGMVAGIRIERAALLPVAIGAGAQSVWLDVSLQGDLNGVTETVAVVVSNADQVDYIDSVQRAHYLVKVADVSAAGVVTDRRKVHQITSDVFSFLTREATADYPGLAERATLEEMLAGLDNKRFITSTLLRAFANWLIPPGIVVMWSGAANAIPQGWALHAAMADRFVVGMGPTYDQGATGGTDYRYTSETPDHVHLTDYAEDHDHGIEIGSRTLAESQGPPHRHPTGSSGAQAPMGAALAAEGYGAGGATGWSGGGLPHDHPGDVHPSGRHRHNALNGGRHLHGTDVRPRWYAIAFIIKVAV